MAEHERTERPTTGPAIPNLGRTQRVTGLDLPDFDDEPPTVSTPTPEGDLSAVDPAFEGDLDHRSPDPELARPTNTAPRHAAPAPSVGRSREAFVREPVPHVTQPAVDLMDEDDTEGAIDYAHESGFTTRRGPVLSGAGYRRSRADEKRFKKDLRYGQYLSVPKGRRDLFSSKRQTQRRRVTMALAAVIALAVVALVVWLVVR